MFIFYIKKNHLNFNLFAFLDANLLSKFFVFKGFLHLNLLNLIVT